jgi:hypothetical protein
VAEGVKVTTVAQEALTVKAPVQVFELIEKSPGLVPVRATEVKLTTDDPLLVVVIVADELVVLTVYEPKAQVVFENDKVEGAEGAPVPAIATV